VKIDGANQIGIHVYSRLLSIVISVNHPVFAKVYSAKKKIKKSVIKILHFYSASNNHTTKHRI